MKERQLVQDASFGGALRRLRLARGGMGRSGGVTGDDADDRALSAALFEHVDALLEAIDARAIAAMIPE